MRVLRDSIHVDAPPDAVWTWLTGLSDHYTEWHPDHVSAEWVEGEPNRVGSVLEAVEYLAGRREVLRFEITDVIPAHRMEYRILGAHGLVLPGGSFEINAENGGARFIATIRARLGGLSEKVLSRRVDALRTHMREEGQNLKQLVETAS